MPCRKHKEVNQMETNVKTQMEKDFLSLPRQERESIISHGTALRLSDLKKRLFLAQSKALKRNTISL